jgi:ribosomal protein S18 acetylase RimI-like enzyme
MPIRLLTKADKEPILTLDKSIFGEIDGGWSSEDFDAYFSPERCYVFHQEENANQIIGYIFSRESKHNTYISNIGVDKEYEGQGIGKELMKKVMLNEYERSKKRPYSVKLQVRDDNDRALNFYQRLGFVENSRGNSWIHMEAKALAKQFDNTINTLTTDPIIDVKPQKIEEPESSNSSYSFSFQFLLSLGTATAGLALLIAGLIVGALPLAAVGAGLLVVGTVGALHSSGFFSKKPPPQDEEELASQLIFV